MAKLFTPNDPAWVDEELVDDPLYNVKEEDDTPIYENVKIELATEVGEAGTSLTAARMNNIEDGLDAVDDAVNVEGHDAKETPANVDLINLWDPVAEVWNSLSWEDLKANAGGTVPVKASTAEVLAGTDDAKFLTPLSAKGLPSIYPDSTPDADLTAHGIIGTFSANENQVFSDACFVNADGQMQLGDASAIASAKIVVMCADSTISADASGNYLFNGLARNDAWNWTPGGLIYLSRTGTSGNTMTQTSPADDTPVTDDCIVILGVATHADRMYFNPQLVIVEHV